VYKMNAEITAVTKIILKLYWRVYFLETINDCGLIKAQWFRRKWKVSSLVYFKLLSYEMRKKMNYKLLHFCRVLTVTLNVD